MYRLLDWPRYVGLTSMAPLTGPRAVRAAATESVSGYVQTVASPFGLLRWQFSFPRLRDEALRRHRGLVTALHGGANAVRVPFVDPDVMPWRRMGVALPENIEADAGWSSGVPWSNGCAWGVGRPTVPLAEASAVGANTIRLVDGWWGHHLDSGDMIGFAPFHFGLYFVTEVIEPGRYRIWPPLRRAVATSDEATLTPVLAMRLEGESAANLARGTRWAENLTMTLVEVEDADVRDYFTD